MAAAAGFRWEAPPSVVVAELGDYEERLVAAIHRLADYFAAKMEAHAKQHAQWTDRTGASRQGIAGLAVKEATRIVLYLFGQTAWFPFLELGTVNMAPRPILLPTLARHHAEIMAAVRGLIGGR